MEKGQYRVLMIGPSRTVHGGISGVVNNYYAAGIEEKIALRYLATMVEGSKLRKLWQALFALLQYVLLLPHYDVVHIHMASDRSYQRKSYFIRLAKLFRKPLILHQHGGDFQTFYFKEQDEHGRARIRKVLNMADVFLVLTPHWRDFFGKLLPQEKIVVFPNTIPVPPAFPKQYGSRKLLFLGRICKEKGICELFEALSSLLETFPDVHLYLGGIWEQQLQDQGKVLGDHVTYLGWLSGEEKEKMLRECDLYVLPSYFEGQPVSILEAMAHYCCVLATDTGGIPEMIAHGENGFLVTPKDVNSLREGLIKLLSDPALCQQYGQAARVTIEERFSLTEHMASLFALYEACFSQDEKRNLKEE